jgi:hypothetical protein
LEAVIYAVLVTARMGNRERMVRELRRSELLDESRLRREVSDWMSAVGPPAAAEKSPSQDIKKGA